MSSTPIRHPLLVFALLVLASGSVWAINQRFDNTTLPFQAQLQGTDREVLEGDTIVVQPSTHTNFRCSGVKQIPINIPAGLEARIYEFTGNELPQALGNDGKPVYGGKAFQMNGDNNTLTVLAGGMWYYMWSSATLTIDCIKGSMFAGGPECEAATCPTPPDGCQWGGGTDEHGCQVCGTLLCNQ